jgi:hypothetical protein
LARHNRDGFRVNLALADAVQIADEASRLVGWPVLSAIPVRRGGNNRVFQLMGQGSQAILKIYPTQEQDPRDRLRHEFGALSFLARCGVAEVPRPIACDPGRHCAAYEWIEGVPPGPPDAAEVDELADFFIRLQQLRDRPGAEALPEGATPALSPARVVEQLGQRLDRLRAVIAPETPVAAFVEGSLAPEIARAVERMRQGCVEAGVDFTAALPQRYRVLSPSDFGLHNALRRPSGKLAFLDFEYFGWDEPAKAVADVMLHAGMSLSPALARRYRERVTAALIETDPQFPARLRLFFPAIRAVWCLILLNEFLPERWARRVLAGVTEDREKAEASQFQKARLMLVRELD